MYGVLPIRCERRLGARLVDMLGAAVGPRAALEAGVIQAAEYSPFDRARALMTLELILAIFLAVPLLIWIMRALPYNRSVERS